MSKSNPRYVKKIGEGENARYFYSWDEWRRYQRVKKAEKKLEQRPSIADMYVKQKRHEEAVKRNKATMESAKKRDAEWLKPEKVSIPEYLTGGENAKSLRQDKKTLRGLQRDMKKTQRKLNREKKKVDKYVGELQKNGRLNSKQKQKLREAQTALQKEKEHLQRSQSKASTYQKTIARRTIRYENATLLGQIRKAKREATSKVKNTIKRYASTTMTKVRAAVNYPVIKTKG